MAEKPYSFETTKRESDGVALIKWTGLENGDTGKPFVFPAHSDRSVQVLGTFGAGGNVVIEGCLAVIPSTYGTLNDPQGNPLSFSATRLEAVLENATNVRPRVTAGDVTTSIDVYMLMTK